MRPDDKAPEGFARIVEPPSVRAATLTGSGAGTATVLLPTTRAGAEGARKMSWRRGL